MRTAILLLALPALAACATPREGCLRSATRDIAVVDRLILETQANLSRGYAIDEEPYITSNVNLCVGNGGYHRVGWSYCNQPTTRYRQRPVTIDRAAEQRKLAELKQTRARLTAEAGPRLAQCNARYPSP
ncbi:hypothetical protein [Tropicimonas isoalkanivorans]|uniref:Uncharacterized protein n=1 Tax=Tropicimonas isoalkanivorans TaxID=441112 RepID=A0A1I1RHC1_9RHOB|nr:hypothetical protein [Tropicimonas isoalkanivorans]SFD31608.1 hypothetical protein SAMN04488094_13116 [Tropicimonas isoalkanivorans]